MKLVVLTPRTPINQYPTHFPITIFGVDSVAPDATEGSIIFAFFHTPIYNGLTNASINLSNIHFKKT